IMAELTHALAINATQDIDQVLDAEPLAGPVDAGECFLRGRRGIPGFRWIKAIVAIAAIRIDGVAEVAEQLPAPAARAFRVADQRIELAAFDAFALLGGIRLADELRQWDHISQPIGHPGVGRQAITTGAAGYLVIAFETPGQVEMRAETHLGLVGAHAAGNRR